MLHVIASVIIFFITATLFSEFYDDESIIFPLAAAVLFAVHPIHTEPVNWAIGLSELSMSLFCMLSFYFFMKSYKKGQKAQVIPSFFLFIALLFKVTAAFFLPVYIVYDYVASRKRNQGIRGSKDIQTWTLPCRYIPLLIAIIGYLALFMTATAGEADPVRTNHIRLDSYNLMINIPILLLQYLEKLVLPANLNALYVFHPVYSPTDLRFLAPLSALISCAIIAAAAIKKDSFMLLCAVWIISPLVPCLYLPATGYSYYVFAERYLYLPSAGYVIAVAAIARTFSIKPWAVQTRTIVFSLIAIIILLFWIMTIQRNKDWKDDFNLWSDTVQKSPDSDVAHNNLGVEYEHRGMLDEALNEYEAAISLNPTYMDAYENRFRVIRLKALLHK